MVEPYCLALLIGVSLLHTVIDYLVVVWNRMKDKSSSL